VNTDFKIPTPKEDDFKGTRSSKSMDKYIAERENDIKQMGATAPPDGLSRNLFRT